MEYTVISDLRRFLAVLHKRRLLLVACLVVSLVGATLYNYTVRPLYQASVALLFDIEIPNVLAGRPLLEQRRTAEALNNQIQVLSSRDLAEAVVEKLRLDSSPELQAGPLISPWERVQRLFGRGPLAEIRSGALPPTIAAFRSRLGAELTPQSRVINLHFRAYDPALAAQVVNTLAELYISGSTTSTEATRTEAQGWLSQRVGEQKQEIGRSEETLREYERQQGVLNFEEQQRLAQQKLDTLNSALLAARTDRIQRETLYDEIRRLPPEQRDSLPAAVASNTVQAAKTRLDELRRERARLDETLGEKHPDVLRVEREIEQVQSQLSRELDRIVQSIDTEYRVAQKREASLLAALEPVQQELRTLKDKAVEYGLLKREAEARQQMYRNLVTRTQETRLEGALNIPAVRLVERAEAPTMPISPLRARNYRLALLIGLGLGIGLSLLLEQLDDSLRTPDDVREHLKLPFLGMVPEAGDGHSRKAPATTLVLGGSPHSPLAESYRVVRTNLIFSSAETRHRCLMVSSVNPQEGKSTTIANLGVSLAQNGAKVLVIDADLRRPTVHKNFRVKSAPGLSELIVGSSPLADVVRREVAPRLDVLPSGYLPPNPAELLGSAAMSSLLHSLKESYEWVLVDAPPLLTMADAPILCPLVDAVVLVVLSERTARHAVLQAVEQVRAVGGRLAGVVLNRVNLTRNSYYYGRYYGDYYRTYYRETSAQEVKGGTGPGARRG